MASKDKASGLFSRVVNFVRGPVASDSDAEPVAVSQPGESRAQAIERVLQRKAHNDAVRKREFAQLRKLRLATPVEAAQMLGQDSFFLESSGFSVLQERASTLKKIDVIEAQMSHQWWHSRSTVNSASLVAPTPAPVAVTDPDNAFFAAATASQFVATQPTTLAWADPGLTEPAPGSQNQIAAASDIPERTDRPAERHLQTSELAGNSVFSAARKVAAEIGQMRSDPTLEGAALQFANGDDAAAETALLAALRATDADPMCAGTWATALFDLYRGTGQQQRFERLAIDYAQRFGRAAPVWVSTPTPLPSPARFEPTNTPELVGQLKGDLSAPLSRWPTCGTAAAPLSVACERLIRVDFAAAGSLLNWVAQRQQQGCQVEFAQVSPLVAAFFSLIGINEHARIRVRNL